MGGIEPLGPPFPFIVGVGRSGTTLLRTILDAHPDLAVVHESRFLGFIATHRQRYERGGKLDTDRLLVDLLDPASKVPSRLGTFGLEPAEVEAAIARSAPTDLATALRAVYQQYASHAGATRYADKTPGYVTALAALGRLFPEAVFLHLVRDGRDVALSMLEVDFGGVNVAHAAWLWSSRVEAGHRAGTVLGPDRYLALRYEDLVGDPAGSMETVCSHFRLEPHPAMLEYFRTPERIGRGLDGQHHHDRLRMPITPGVRDWRSQMAEREVVAFEHVAGRTLRDLGYETTGARLTRTSALVASADIARGRAVAAWRARRRQRDRRAAS